MTRPGDELAAGMEGGGRLRAGHADREHAIEVLKAAFVQGRLTKDELEARVGQAFTARTFGELAAVTADLSAEPTGVRPPRQPDRARARPAGNATVRKGVRVIASATVIPAGLWAVLLFAFPDNSRLTDLVMWVTRVWFMIMVLIVPVMLESWFKRRSGRQLPPRSSPGPGSKASVRPASAAPAGQLPQAGPGQPDTVEAAEGDLPRRRSSSSRKRIIGVNAGIATIGYASN